ncbi:MAG: HAMP domain-containing sensor histidine kinase [Bacteroidota bacterium]
MFKKIWNKLLYPEKCQHFSEAEKRRFEYINAVLIIFIAVTALLTIAAVIVFGFLISFYAALSCNLFFIGLFFLNRSGFILHSGFLLSLVFPLSILFVSIATKKFNYDVLEHYEYFEFRYLLVIAPFIPLSIFKLKESEWVMPALASSFFSIIMYDPIHNLFNVGYYQMGLEGTNYYFVNAMVVVAYLLVVASILFQKRISEHLERKTEIQSDRLRNQNTGLEEKLQEKNLNLIQANRELLHHNAELRQFSYTVSHNLRGPVASLLGLTNILNQENLIKPEGSKVKEHIQSTTEALDSVISDLSQVIETRNSIYEIKKRIYFQEKINRSQQLLESSINQSGTIINCDCEKAPYIYSNEAFIGNILYNLISNSIKYRARDRISQVDLETYKKDGKIVIKLSDNGLGIDLERYGNDLFKMYKRFHLHTEGKGLGLYMVKLQTEMLGGEIDVESEVNKGTTFTLTFNDFEINTVEHYYEDEDGIIFHDILTNTIGVEWKRDVTPQVYRNYARKNLDFVKKYNSPNWISNVSNQSKVNEESGEWMIKNIMPEAVESGLRRVALVVGENIPSQIEEYLQGVGLKSMELGLETRKFETLTDARSWLISHSNWAAKTV